MKYIQYKETRMTLKQKIQLTLALTRQKIKPMFIGSILMLVMINFIQPISSTYDEIKQLHRINKFKTDFINGVVDDSVIEENKYRIAGNAKEPSQCLWAIDNKVLTIREYNKAFTKEQREQRVNDPLNYLKEACK